MCKVRFDSWDTEGIPTLPNPIFCHVVLVIIVPYREQVLHLFLFLLKKPNCSLNSPFAVIVRLEASVAIDCAAAFQKKALKIVSLNLSKSLKPNVSVVPAF